MQFDDKRLEGVKSAQNMTRFALASSLILSALLLVSQYNAYLSWYRVFASDFHADRHDSVSHLRTKVAEQWLEGRSFKIPFVDIPILPSDVGVVGGLGVTCCVWFLLYYSRREHLLVCLLLKDAAETADQSLMRSILHSVLPGFLFVPFKLPDAPYQDIDELPELKNLTDSQEKYYAGSWRYWVICFGPLTLLVCTAIGIRTYFQTSPFRGEAPVMDWEQNWLQFLGQTGAGLLFAAVAWRCCHRVLAYHKATATVTSDFIARLGAAEGLDFVSLGE